MNHSHLLFFIQISLWRFQGLGSALPVFLERVGQTGSGFKQQF
jgi:hypothetical protein